VDVVMAVQQLDLRGMEVLEEVADGAVSGGDADSGTANTGGGGASAVVSGNGGDGGSGIVIIKIF